MDPWRYRVVQDDDETQPHANGVDRESVSSYTFDPIAHREALAKLIVCTDLPLDFGEDPFFEEYVRNVFYPDFQRVSRRTTRNDIKKLHNKERQKLFGELIAHDHNIALSFDIWSSKSQVDYISVAAHYVDENWILQKRILGFKGIDLVHTGENVASQILDVLNNWRISSRVMAITFDDAFPNDRAIQILKSQLHPHSGYALLHQQCACLIIHVIAQDGLKCMSDCIEAIRKAVRYLNFDNTKKVAWMSYCAARKRPGFVFPTDITTQWDSTYLTLHKIMEYKDLFTSWYNSEIGEECLTDKHWTDAACLDEFLEVFYRQTVALSTVYNPTSPLVLHALTDISNVFKKYMDDPLLSATISDMTTKFAKYWAPVPPLYCFAVILDPRLRTAGLRGFMDILQENLGFPYADSVDETQRSLADVYKMYELKYAQTAIDEPILSQSPLSTTWPKVRERMARYTHGNMQGQRNDLSAYLEENFADANANNLDLLRWWKKHSAQYPILSILARDVLSVPASIVSSQSAFSSSGRILDDRRTMENPRMVEILTLTKDWLRAAPRLQEENNGIEERFQSWNIDDPPFKI